jgi:hypothetical protein
MSRNAPLYAGMNDYATSLTTIAYILWAVAFQMKLFIELDVVSTLVRR